MDEAYTMLEKAIRKVSKLWLKDDDTKAYMFGDQPSIADLSLACELTTLDAFDYDMKGKFPRIHRWLTVDMPKIPGFSEIDEEGVNAFRMIVAFANKRKAKFA